MLEEEAAEKAAKEKNYPNFEAGDLLELTLVRPPPPNYCSSCLAPCFMGLFLSIVSALLPRYVSLDAWSESWLAL